MPSSLDSFILHLSEEPLPKSWHTASMPEKPWVEIGFGNGEFLIHLAQSHPERLVVGIEMSLTSVLKAARRAQRGPCPNIRLLHGDARFLLRETFSDEAVERIYMNFPCPWPKQRHARRRVTASSFASGLAAVLSLGGEFHLATDEQWYAEEVLDVLSAHPALNMCSLSVNPLRPITTKYERKWLASGKDIFSVIFQKTTLWTVPRLVKGATAMHAEVPFAGNLKGRLPDLVGKGGGNEGLRWFFLEWFWSDDHVALVPTLANDEGFEQRFLLRVVERPGSLLVKVDAVASPYRTPAVAAAVRAAAQILSAPLSTKP